MNRRIPEDAYPPLKGGYRVEYRFPLMWSMDTQFMLGRGASYLRGVWSYFNEQLLLGLLPVKPRILCSYGKCPFELPDLSVDVTVGSWATGLEDIRTVMSEYDMIVIDTSIFPIRLFEMACECRCMILTSQTIGYVDVDEAWVDKGPYALAHTAGARLSFESLITRPIINLSVGRSGWRYDSVPQLLSSPPIWEV